MSTPVPDQPWLRNTAPAAFTPRPPHSESRPVLPATGRGVHQAATPALAVGTVALLGIPWAGIPLLLSPFAWALGRTAVREIDASGGVLTGRERARAGMVLGIVGTCLIALALVATVSLGVLGVALTGLRG